MVVKAKKLQLISQRNPGLDVPSKADSQSRHAVEAFGKMNLNGNGHANGNSSSGSEHSDDEVRETVNGEVRMGADRVNGHANGNGNGNGKVGGCCSGT